MKGLLLLSLASLSCVAACQYTVSTGTPGNVGGIFVVETITGPASGWHDFVLHNFAWCRQDLGASGEPCPWTLSYQNLYDNVWDYVDTRWLYVASGVTITAVSSMHAQWNTQTITRNADGVQFKRSYKWEIWDEEKVWYSN